ncbi:NOC3L [Enterospora canceri]|uniref:NOC3L n=1 Tax=Enterospora canceri TaxID=1081671 RepID=A0A1Y1S4T5_9MICR|nr:NOC3L [Enterospora canceri]
MLDKLQVSVLCERVIRNPESNLNALDKLDYSDELNGLAVAKVFASICPLYKIRIGSDKIKHKNADNAVEQFDRQLLSSYNAFLIKTLKSKEAFSYKIASYLLEELDHFNFNDRLVMKVLLGLRVESVRKICIGVLCSRIEEDNNGETIWLILDHALDYGIDYEVLNALLKSKYLAKCVQIKHEKETKYEKKVYTKEKTKKDPFYNKKKLRGISKKEEKTRCKKEKETKAEEGEVLDGIDNKIYVRTRNALQRIYFTILKEKKTKCIEAVCKGLCKYFTLVNREFYEGLLYLFTENLVTRCESRRDVINNIEIVKTIYEVFKSQGIDFGKISEYFLNMLEIDTQMHVTVEQFDNEFVGVLRLIFLENRQQNGVVLKMLKKLVGLSICRYLPVVTGFIKEVEIKYDIDIKEHYKQTDCETNFAYFLMKSFP